MTSEIDQFILYIATERGLSPAYQLSVRQSLEALEKWLGEKAVGSWSDVGTQELTAFLTIQKDNGLSASSLRINMVHMKIFFRYLTSKKLTLSDPAEPLLPPRGDMHLPETLNEQHIANLLESVDVSKLLGRRDRAILEVFYASGLRLSELCNTRLENLDLEERLSLIHI